MSTQVSESFIKQFEADVHLSYQQNGSKLRNTVRTKNNVKRVIHCFSEGRQRLCLSESPSRTCSGNVA